MSDPIQRGRRGWTKAKLSDKAFRRQTYYTRFSMGLARAAATSSLRNLDPTNPASWEFCGFSQNGEDGIIDYLTSRLLRRNRYFIEIGSSDGFENNTSWLALGRRWSGLMIEGDEGAHLTCKEAWQGLNFAVELRNIFVDTSNVAEALAGARYREPDLFSLDIDGVDLYVAAEILRIGLRPKIFVVEYNSGFGPELSVTVKYKPDFDRRKENEWGLYYGASVRGWRDFFSSHGYRFLTVEQNGVNAFFVDPAWFDEDFLIQLEGEAFLPNVAQIQPAKEWEAQLELLGRYGLVEVSELLTA